MTSGHAKDTLAAVIGAPDGDWVKAFLAFPVSHIPGTCFVYNSGASYILSAILQTVTGETLEEFLSSRLFRPLGFDDVLWDKSPTGVNTGGWGIMVRLEDLAKLGQLYLDKGMYAGKQIISPQWVELATSCQADTSKTDNQRPDWIQGYGFHFWRCQHGAFRADGVAGQYCIVMPEQSAVLVVMSEILNMQEILDVLWDTLLPGFDNTDSSKEAEVDRNIYNAAQNTKGIAAISIPFESHRFLMKNYLLSYKVIQAVETRVQVLHEENRRATTDSWMWVYRSGELCYLIIR